jgi:hypothetical protein
VKNGIIIKEGRMRVYVNGRHMTGTDAQRYLWQFNNSYDEDRTTMLFKELFTPMMRSYQHQLIYQSTIHPRDN